MSDDESKAYLVVTGSSAGGIDALLQLVAGLPADFAPPIVIAQHLDPAHASRLDHVLRQRTKLPVRVVQGREPLLGNGIYVIPPDSDATVADGAVTVVWADRTGPKPSIDRLFATAAEQYGDRLIAIIFSGMGHDGLAGARLVKEHGGTVIIQDPQTATHPSMPLAIPPTLIDLVGAPDQIPAMLVNLLQRTELPDGAEPGQLSALLNQIRDRTGIDFFQYKTPTIMRRLSRLMVASGVTSLAEYVRYLQHHPDEYQRLVSSFLIKVTEFFRDAPLFEALKDTILPKLIEDARGRDRELRIWSAGTSTGEESYSLAILCAELLREEPTDFTVRIFATDIDEDAITFARRGIYSREALQHVPVPWIERYFNRMGDAYEVAKRVRNMTVFGQHDLAQRAPFPRTDLCVCRNVLIYFTGELQARALQLFAFSLRDGGYLVLGKAESTTLLSQYFRTVNQGLKIFQRQGDRNLIPPPRLRDTITTGLPDMRSPKAVPGLNAAIVPLRSGEPRSTTNETLGGLLAGSDLGVVVVDRRYDITALNPAARTLLDLHSVGIGEDLIHLARRVDSHALREIIDTAFRREPVLLRELPLAPDETGQRRCLQITCWPDSPTAASSERVALLVADVSAAVATRQRLEEHTTRQAGELEQMGERNRELQARQKVLLEANEELTAANAELRSANEQLLINAEEAASANEEIETLNEELQATNEELETLNEELQATVEELNTTNDELEARSSELEHAVGVGETSLLGAQSKTGVLGVALAKRVGVVAIVGADGKIVYADPVVANWLRTTGDHAWETSAPVRIGDVTYRTRVTPLEVVGGTGELVEFLVES